MQGAWLAILDIQDRIDAMQIADEVEEGVARAIRSHRILGLTLAQKAAGLVFSCVLLAAALVEILTATGTI
jgi:hypothetical protein